MIRSLILTILTSIILISCQSIVTPRLGCHQSILPTLPPDEPGCLIDDTLYLKDAIPKKPNGRPDLSACDLVMVTADGWKVLVERDKILQNDIRTCREVLELTK